MSLIDEPETASTPNIFASSLQQLIKRLRKLDPLNFRTVLWLTVLSLVCVVAPARGQGALSTTSTGINAKLAASSVFRIVCPTSSTYGTGFLHKSGLIITAAHVVSGCPTVFIVLPNNSAITGAVWKVNDQLDLALIKPAKSISATPFSLSSQSGFLIGTEVSLWGFPAGYNGHIPMLSVGYLSGIDSVTQASGQTVQQWVLNAALNHGDSGGPVVQVETGQVIGVAVSKIAPLSDNALGALGALENEHSGFTYVEKLADGTTKTFTEAQVVAMVLEELRQQVQLVIGHAVLVDDLRAFLSANNVDP